MKTEDHVNVADREKLLSLLDVVENLLAGTELITLGHLQNSVVKALYTDRHAVY